ncbi:MAG: ornithine carbamoyltransferase, partial [Patescibacteria group bacterium]
ASFNQIPVIDGCSEKYHPVQSLGDMLTMIEYSRGIQNIKKVVWLGVENNVSNTLKVLCAKLDVPITIAAPEVDSESVDKKLDALANKSGLVTYTSDIKMALEGADYIHTDTWMNMEFFENGKIRTQFCEEFERRKKVFLPYQLSASLVNKYAPRARIMHCMPYHVGYEISRDAIDHKNSIIFDQAENRLHVSKGIITWLLDKK